ncbi:MAG: cytochrome c biogenesis protein CcdA [Bacteroidales bacterium]|jgi:thiol:disulfide interchange protein DsbD|nr:cytochrome c biogenesis protein CcdA [Bacteroidales bacterium]
MIKNILRFSYIYILFFVITSVHAQILEPVKWRFSTEQVNDTEFDLIFTADIENKWHLYSQDIPMSPPATNFNFDVSDRYELIGKTIEESEVVEEYDPNFEMVLKFFTFEAVFKQRVKVLSQSPVKVTGYLEFMCCDDTKCLPPTDVDFEFNLSPPGATTAVPVQGILEPVEWQIKTEKTGNRTVDIFFTATIDDGYHLYSVDVPEDGPLPTEFIFENQDGFELLGQAVEITTPIEEFDDVFELDIKFFERTATFKQTIRFTSDKDQIPVIGEIAYMVCNDVGCVALYEDVELLFNGETDQLIIESQQEDTEVGMSDIQGKKASLWGFFILSFLGGLAAILTPCVFPMIPMTVSFFMKDGEEKAKGKMQAIIYGISIIAIYTFIGSILAVVAGPDIANWLSTHWLPNILFFLIFVIFAASFFGMFEIVLPSWMVNKTDQKADKGGFLGPVFMAVTLVLVSFSCTGPIVGTILVESAGGQVVKPIIGMLGFSLAFALPFTLFAFFPSLLQGLPKSGGWLNAVKVVLGFLELALGLKFLSIADQTYHWGILDREVYLAFWIVIFFLMGMYLLGKIKFAHDSDLPFVSVPRLMFAIITFSFVMYLIPGMFGAPLKALSGYIPPQSTHDFDLNAVIRNNVELYAGSGGEEVVEICDKPKYADFLHLPHGLEGYFDYDQALSCAKEQNKPIFIDFTGHGCVNCREMEANVWSDPKVLKILREDYIILALYVDDKTKLAEDEWVKSEYDGKMKKTIGKKYADLQITKFGVNAQPFYVLMGHDSEVLTQPRAYDLDVDEFVEFLEKGIKNFEEGKNAYVISN